MSKSEQEKIYRRLSALESEVSNLRFLQRATQTDLCGVIPRVNGIDRDLEAHAMQLKALEESVKRHAVAELEMRGGFRACDVRISKLNDRCDELQRACIGVGKDAQESEVREFGQPIAEAANKAAEYDDRIGSYIDQLWESFEVQRAAIIGDGYQQKPATMNGDFYAGALHALDKLTSYMRGMGK